MPLKLAVVSTHPIQYYAPVFRTMAGSADLVLRVFYTWSQSADEAVFDRGFGAAVTWDVPLLDGYDHRFVPNVAGDPGVHHFGGLRNPTLVSEIEDWGADAVLVYGWNSLSHLRVLLHFKGRIPVLFRGDSTLLDPRPWWRAAVRRGLLGWVYRHVDRAIAVGSNSRDYFSWCGMSESQIAFAPHSVDVARFTADSAENERRAAEWRLSLGIGTQAVVFLFAGKLQDKKDPLLLLRAFCDLAPGCHLILAGAGELEAVLREAAGGRADVHFLPFQNQSAMPTVYRLGDVFVLPSRGPGETWGLALNEAMAAGRPLIASSRVGGARDLIRSGVNGWTFTAADLAGLRSVLSEAVAAGRTGLAAMGQASRERIGAWSAEESARLTNDAVIDAVRRVRASRPSAPRI